ncbi:MAG: 50S ribosomal protein L28 [bacterium]|nr:50S ribosomal protein L28 [bacterium]
MSRTCDYCGKGPATGNMVSHSNRRTRRRWLPNLHKVSVQINGSIRTLKVCTRCLRSWKNSQVAE